MQSLLEMSKVSPGFQFKLIQLVNIMNTDNVIAKESAIKLRQTRGEIEI